MRIYTWLTLTFILLMFGLVVQYVAIAEDANILEVKIIGSTFKSLAKAYVAITDLESLRRENITKLNRTEDAKFRSKYTKVYDLVRELPKSVKNTYRISDNIRKDQIIQKLETWDKRDICLLIDSIPDEIIAKYFKEYLKENKSAISGKNIFEQVRDFWQKMLSKISKNSMLFYPKLYREILC